MSSAAHVPTLAEVTASRDALLAGLRSGASEHAGQDLLREAFTAYLDAASLPEGKAKAERIFHANALVGYHEQIRLQDAIAGALAAVRVLIPEAVPKDRLIASSTCAGSPLARRRPCTRSWTAAHADYHHSQPRRSSA